MWNCVCLVLYIYYVINPSLDVRIYQWTNKVDKIPELRVFIWGLQPIFVVVVVVVCYTNVFEYYTICKTNSIIGFKIVFSFNFNRTGVKWECNYRSLFAGLCYRITALLHPQISPGLKKQRKYVKQFSYTDTYFVACQLYLEKGV